MGRKNRKRGIEMDGTMESCRASTKTVKKRYKQAKKDFKLILVLAEEGKFPYDSKGEIVGRAYLDMHRFQMDYDRSRAQDKIMKARHGK